jgi:hypothetical protein
VVSGDCATYHVVGAHGSAKLVNLASGSKLAA